MKHTSNLAVQPLHFLNRYKFFKLPTVREFNTTHTKLRGKDVSGVGTKVLQASCAGDDGVVIIWEMTAIQMSSIAQGISRPEY